ncbi:MAG: dephospho-CoA kinase [Pirellulales bacterium]
MMTVVGLIGRIAAGKSTVARAFASQGAEVIDADRIAHEVLADRDVVQEVARRYGPETVDAEGRVRRPVLAGAVFGPSAAHDKALVDLEAIVHPRVRQRIEDRLATIAAAPGGAGKVVVLDVPLLVQAGWDGRCDSLVLVECVEEERQRRLDGRGWPEIQRAARERAWQRGYQPPGPEKTLVVDASGDPAYTRSQVDRIVRSLSGK